MPLMATLPAVMSVAHRTTTTRSRVVSTPMLRASASLTVSRFTRQRSSHNGISPTRIGSTANCTSRALMDVSEPISQ